MTLSYCDPPYIDEHVDYYNGWDSNHENSLLNPYLIFKVNSYCQPGITMIIEKTNT